MRDNLLFVSLQWFMHAAWVSLQQRKTIMLVEDMVLHRLYHVHEQVSVTFTCTGRPPHVVL